MRDMRKEGILIVLVVVGMVSFIQAVSAEDLFFEDFETDLLLSKWNLTTQGGARPWSVVGTNPQGGFWHAETNPTSSSEPAAVMEINISTSGYSSVKFEYYKRLVQLDASDEFKVRWYDGSTWNTVEETGSGSGNDAGYVFRSFDLPAGAGDNPDFKIRFECTADLAGEYCRVDNVNVSGLFGTFSPSLSLKINSPSEEVVADLTPNLNVTVSGDVDAVWFSLDGRENITYAHRNGTIDFAYLDSVFIDDFDTYPDGADGSPAWTTSSQFAECVMVNGTYKLYNETPVLDALAYITDFDQYNYGGSAKAMVPSGYFGGAYLTPRFGDVNWKYEIALDYDWSSININKVVDGEFTSLAARWTGEEGIFVSKDNWYTIGFEIEDDNLTAFVDGVEMISASDSDLNYTGFSLIAYDFEDQHMAYFDDVEMHRDLDYGWHTLRVWANDSSGEENFTMFSFVVDSPLPVVEVLYPLNQTYGYEIRELNYSVFDLNLSSCWYSLDGGLTNFSVSCGENVTGLSSVEGSNSWIVWANDTNGNESYADVTFSVDITSPYFYGYVEEPENGTNYSSGANYEFNVSVDSADFVGVEFEGVNYSVTSLGSVYTFSISDLAAGDYSYFWWANDSLGNFNVSEIMRYTVGKASQIAILSFSESSPVGYGTYVNVTCNGELFRDDVNVTGDIGESVLLGAGSYEYSCKLYENQNYTFDEDNATFEVDRVQSEVNLTLNGTEGNVTVMQGDSISLNGTLVVGDPSGLLRVYLDGGLISEGFGEVGNLTLFSSTGLFNVTLVYIDSENYTMSFENYWVSVVPLPNQAPVVTLGTPVNGSMIYGSSAILNLSVTDFEGENMTVWFYGDGGLVVTRNNVPSGWILQSWAGLSGGWHSWFVVANDGAENGTSETWWFYTNLSTPTGTRPRVYVDYPSYASTYSSNESIALNFSVSGEDLDTCWYSLDRGLTNVSLADCLNSTFSVSSSGVYNLTVFANETVEGLVGSEDLEFFVNLNNPTIHLLSPEHPAYRNSSDVELIYVPEFFESLSYCELWGNFVNGTYGLNQTNDSIAVGGNAFYVYNLSEGNYSWAVGCNSSSGNYSRTGNRTLISDYTPPSVSVSTPGSVTEGNDVPVDFDVVDTSPVVCSYNLTYSSDGTQVQFKVIEGCEDTTINIALPKSSYTIYVEAEDAAGNTGSSSTGFSVVAPTTGGDTGGSSGSGSSGGGGGIVLEPGLALSKIDDIFIERGTSQSLVLNVENDGGQFLNNCELEFEGDVGGWFSSGEVKGLSSGEKFAFEFELEVPEDVEPEKHSFGVVVDCDEHRESQLFDVFVYRNIFEAEILDYEKDGTKLKVRLQLSENAGRDRDVGLEYSLIDLDGFVRYSDEQVVFLGAGQVKEEVIEFELPKDSFGEFDFEVKLSDGETEIIVNEGLFLPSSGGLTGLAISEDNRRTLSYVGIGVAVLIILVFAISLFKKNKRKAKKKEVLKSKHFDKKKNHKTMVEFQL